MPKCPECSGSRIYKDGLRYGNEGQIQRFLCRDCGYRFSEKSFKQCQTNRDYQLCVIKKAKKLDSQTEIKTVAGKSLLEKQTIKGKLLEFEFWMQKQGYSKPTMKARITRMKTLLRRGANLLDPESVKKVIALQKTWCDGTKANVADDYSCFLEKEGVTWNPPRYKRQETIPFIPSETELNMLIASTGKKLHFFKG